MAELSIHRLPQQIIMAEERDLDFELANSSYNQWRTNPFLAAINFNPFGPSTIDQVTFDSDWFSDSGCESDTDEIHSSERLRAFNGYGPGLGSASNPSSDIVNEHGNWGFEDEDFNGIEPRISISDSDSNVPHVHSCIIQNDTEWAENANNLRNGFGLQELMSAHEDFEWEDVLNRVGQRGNQNVVADGLEELPETWGIAREQANRIEAAQILEWEFLLRINDHPRDAMVEHGIDRQYFLADENDLTNPFDYDALLAQFVDDDDTFRGSPPASRSVVENLPLVELKTEKLEDDKVVCSICKDDIPLEEKVKKLPCSHYYHEDCILPWLNIRNTCPACRYEFPTDDPEYERRKTQRSRAG